MKSREEIMNMLEAFDLCGSLRGPGELAGVSHHTVARYVAERDAGELAGGGPRRRGRIIDPFLPKIEEWVERSHAKIRADRAFDKLTALGYTGSMKAGAFTPARPTIAVVGGGCIGRGSPSRACGRNGLGRRSGHRGPKDESVLCVAGVVAVPGGGAVLGSQVGDGDRLCGSGDASLRRRSDVLAHRNEPRSRSITSRGCRSGIRRWSRSAATTGSRWRRVCRRPRVQGRVRGDGAGRQSRFHPRNQLGRAGRGL